MKRKPGQIKSALKLPARAGTLSIREHPERVSVKLRFSRYGEFGDLDQIGEWLLPYLQRYEDDPRPIVMDHPRSGEVISIYGDANYAFGLVRRCDS